MNRQEIVDTLRAELDALPEYPSEENQTDSGFREYDEELNEKLEILRDMCRMIVDSDDDTACVYPGCCHTRRTRGLCHGHYQIMRSRVRAGGGKALERDLEARGLLLRKGTGGVPARDTLDAFRIGSDVRGEA